MAVSPGTRLGPYEVLSRIGAGGMGEVYKARDSRLDRTVAIKVLSERLSLNPEARERFEREARTIANLKHPHICVLYDIGEQNGAQYLVMEYLEGETLADRLSQSRARQQADTSALPLDQVLRYAIEISDALDKAHRHGATHRDVKPANIMLTKEGSKLLDFGLAKLRQEVDPSLRPSEMPTAAPGLTDEGTILGTMQYMAPEQVEGKIDDLDARTDIFSFGATVYEMATGKKAFEGKSKASLMAAILKDEPPPMSKLQPMSPPALDRVVKKCLAKDPDDRWQSASDLSEALKWIRDGSAPAASTVTAFAETGVASGPSSSSSAVIPARSGSSRAALWVAASLVACVLTALAAWKLRPAPAAEPKTVSRFAITLPPGDRLQTSANGPVLDLSPDGSRIVYLAIHAGVQQLFARGIDSMEAQAIRGTEGALSPFFSPDGQSLGFFVLPQLKKIAVSGGTPQNLTNVISDNGGVSWGPNDTIVFSRAAAEALRTLPASGGAQSPLTTLKGEISHRWPQLLPGGKAVLFTNYISSGDTSQILVERTDTHERKVLVQGGSYPRYVSSGHLLFVRAATLMAVPFDTDRLEVHGQPVPVIEGVMQTANGAGQFTVSNSGTLVYIPGGMQGVDRTLVWVDRKGAEQPIPAPLRAYYQPKLSPDGEHLALNIDSNVWIYDMVRGTLTRLTFEAGNSRPLWTPDGKRVAYQSTKGGKVNLWWKPADGTGSDEQLTNTDFFFLPSSISPDLTAAYVETHPDTNRDIYVVDLKGDRKSKPWLQTPFDETYPLFSPDGKWIAYVSNESGRFEIYIRPASGTGGKWQISTDGGQADQWNPNGKELFYQNGDKMYSVEIKTEPTFSASTPHLLFEGNYEKQSGVGANYNVSPDGQRFLMIKPGGVRQEGATQINVVLNWFEELKAKVPLAK
jgi:eukaryotic-like serine/threonine-protein kinase